MKRNLLGVFVFVLAIAASAFTTKSNAVSAFYFENGWHEINTLCDEGTMEPCVELINDQPEQIYKTPNFADPLRYNP